MIFFRQYKIDHPARVSLSFILALKLCCSFNSAGESRQKDERERETERRRRTRGESATDFVPFYISNMAHEKEKTREAAERLFSSSSAGPGG